MEQRLPGDARRDQLRVELRVALPRADFLELEQARADVRVEGGALQPFDVGQLRGVDRREAAREPAQIADVRVHRLAAEVLEHVVVQVHAVERGARGATFVEVRQVFVDKMRQRFG